MGATLFLILIFFLIVISNNAKPTTSNSAQRTTNSVQPKNTLETSPIILQKAKDAQPQPAKPKISPKRKTSTYTHYRQAIIRQRSFQWVTLTIIASCYFATITAASIVLSYSQYIESTEQEQENYFTFAKVWYKGIRLQTEEPAKKDWQPALKQLADLEKLDKTTAATTDDLNLLQIAINNLKFKANTQVKGKKDALQTLISKGIDNANTLEEIKQKEQSINLKQQQKENLKKEEKAIQTKIDHLNAVREWLKGPRGYMLHEDIIATLNNFDELKNVVSILKEFQEKSESKEEPQPLISLLAFEDALEEYNDKIEAAGLELPEATNDFNKFLSEANQNTKLKKAPKSHNWEKDEKELKKLETKYNKKLNNKYQDENKYVYHTQEGDKTITEIITAINDSSIEDMNKLLSKKHFPEAAAITMARSPKAGTCNSNGGHTRKQSIGVQLAASLFEKEKETKQKIAKHEPTLSRVRQIQKEQNKPIGGGKGELWVLIDKINIYRKSTPATKAADERNDLHTLVEKHIKSRIEEAIIKDQNAFKDEYIRLVTKIETAYAKINTKGIYKKGNETKDKLLGELKQEIQALCTKKKSLEETSKQKAKELENEIQQQRDQITTVTQGAIYDAINALGKAFKEEHIDPIVNKLKSRFEDKNQQHVQRFLSNSLFTDLRELINQKQDEENKKQEKWKSMEAITKHQDLKTFQSYVTITLLSPYGLACQFILIAIWMAFATFSTLGKELTITKTIAAIPLWFYPIHITMACIAPFAGWSKDVTSQLTSNNIAAQLIANFAINVTFCFLFLYKIHRKGKQQANKTFRIAPETGGGMKDGFATFCIFTPVIFGAVWLDITQIRKAKIENEIYVVCLLGAICITLCIVLCNRNSGLLFSSMRDKSPLALSLGNHLILGTLLFCALIAPSGILHLAKSALPKNIDINKKVWPYMSFQGALFAPGIATVIWMMNTSWTVRKATTTTPMRRR